MKLKLYQQKYADILTGIQPWTSPDGSELVNRKAVLRNGMGRIINTDDTMDSTIIGKDGSVGLDTEYKLENRLMNGLTTVSDKPKPQQFQTPKSKFYTARNIAISDIREDASFQFRVSGVDPDVVDRYANIMEEFGTDGWMAFPEILIMQHASNLNYYLIGGFHRLAAMKRNGYTHINAICFKGSWQQGLIKAAEENTDQSQRLTHEDIKHKCRVLIKSFPEWAFGQLAKWGGVDRNTIERHYQDMLAEGIAPERPDRVKYITRHGTEAQRKATRTQQRFEDEYPDTPTYMLFKKLQSIRDETLEAAIEENGLPSTQYLIDTDTLLHHAKTHHKQIVVDIESMLEADRKKIIDQIKIWSHFAYQADQASLIFTVMFDDFEYHIEKRGGKRFPDPNECNWIVDLGLPNALNEIKNVVFNIYQNTKNELGLADLSFWGDPSFYLHAQKQYPPPLLSVNETDDALSDEALQELHLKQICAWHALRQDIANKADWILAIDSSELEQGLTDAAWKVLHETVTGHQQEAIERWELYKSELGAEFLPFFQADGLYNRFIKPNFQGIHAGFDSSPTNTLEAQVPLWKQVAHNIHAAYLSLTNTAIPMPNWIAQMQQELASPDAAHRNAFQLAESMKEQAMTVYEEQRDALGLTDMDWYTFHEVPGFFEHAIGQLEKQGITLAYPSQNDSIEQLSKKTEIWKQIATDIKTKADWVQPISQIGTKQSEKRQTLLDEIVALQQKGVSSHFPAQYTDEWKDIKPQLEAAYPLYFKFPRREHLATKQLEKMKTTFLKMKADLEKGGIAPFYSDEFIERAAAHQELTDVYLRAKEVFEAHPLSERMDFDDFEAAAEHALKLDSLLRPSFVGGLDATNIRAEKHSWDRIAKALGQNVGWVQTLLTGGKVVFKDLKHNTKSLIRNMVFNAIVLCKDEMLPNQLRTDIKTLSDTLIAIAADDNDLRDMIESENLTD